MLTCYLCGDQPAVRCPHCTFTYCNGHAKHRRHSCQDATEPELRQTARGRRHPAAASEVSE